MTSNLFALASRLNRKDKVSTQKQKFGTSFDNHKDSQDRPKHTFVDNT